jgi:hypothetical protein
LRLRDAFADRFNGPREVTAQDVALWFEEPGQHARDVRRARQGVEVRWIYGRRVNAQPHAIVRDDQLVDVFELQDIK